MKFATLLVFLTLATTAAEQEWIGPARESVFDNETKKKINAPTLGGPDLKNFLLTGKVVAPEVLKQKNGFHFVVTGTLLEDGKTIHVSKMEPRTQFEGIAAVGRPTEKDVEKHFLILHVKGRAWKLKGTLPDFATIKGGKTWSVTGEQLDTKWITVTSMTEVK